LIKWKANASFDPVEVNLVHGNTASGMRLSASGNQIGIATSDGFVKVLETSSLNTIFSEKRHKMPVTCMGFMADIDGDATYILSGSPDYTYNIIPCKSSFIGK
jgi:WD40 repeat protein